jgi:hypothetical protein
VPKAYCSLCKKLVGSPLAVSQCQVRLLRKNEYAIRNPCRASPQPVCKTTYLFLRNSLTHTARSSYSKRIVLTKKSLSLKPLSRFFSKRWLVALCLIGSLLTACMVATELPTQATTLPTASFLIDAAPMGCIRASCRCCITQRNVHEPRLGVLDS